MVEKKEIWREQEWHCQLLNHPLLGIDLNLDIITKYFFDSEKHSFTYKYKKQNPDDELRGAVNLARVIEMGRRMPSAQNLAEIAQKKLLDILRDKKPEPMWDIFTDSGLDARPLSRTYSTSKILLGIGIKGIEDIGFDQIVIPELRKQLIKMATHERLEAYPYLIYLVSRALQHCSAMDIECNKTVGVWADRFLNLFQAQLELQGPGGLSTIYLALALGIANKYLPEAMERKRLKHLISVLIEKFPVLPAQSKNSIIRLESHAIGCSALDALIPLLEDELLTENLFNYPQYIEDTMNWIHYHSQKEDNILCFHTDCFIDERPEELWYNCTVLDFATLLKSCLCSEERKSIKLFLGAKTPRNPYPYQSMRIGGFKWPDILKRRLLDIAKTRIPKGEKLKQNGIVLFGPPGTTKTSVVESMCEYLGKDDWSIVNIGPAQFLNEGFDKLFYQINKIFSVLVRLRQTLILFDEFELLVLVRESDKKGTMWQPELVTDVMLPWFKELHDWGQNIYIIATNNLKLVDKAIIRPRRFDFILPVGPPNKKEKNLLLNEWLDKDHDCTKLAESIDERATIGELSQWTGLIEEKNVKDNDALDLWSKHFKKRLQINNKCFNEFIKLSKKCSFPPEAGEKYD
ncbi:MAG: ATP-binding protein [Vulcanimicrobiota bacterium]